MVNDIHSSLRNKASIVGVGESDIGKVPHMTGLGLNAQAAKRALDDAGLTVGDIDGVTIVPEKLIDQVVAAVREKNSGESQFRKAVKEGMPPSQAFAKYGVL